MVGVVEVELVSEARGEEVEEKKPVGQDVVERQVPFRRRFEDVEQEVQNEGREGRQEEQLESQAIDSIEISLGREQGKQE